jgi:solute carrier family 35, member F1/2
LKKVIDAFIFPITLVLSRIFLKVFYKKNHIIGAIGCLIGCGLLITADFLISGPQGTHRILGDIYCLASSVLYAISNVGQEALIKKYSKLEFLSFTGLFGTLISVIQM